MGKRHLWSAKNAPLLVAASVVCAVLVAQVVMAATAPSTRMIYAAVNRHTGTMRILSGPSAKLKSGEYRLSWNQTGPQGPVGSIGATGPAGSAGSAGAQGAVGQAGPAGPAGAQGVVGATGSQGSVGDIGPIGPQGDKGAPGTQGLKGDTGRDGPAGPEGSKGDTGAAGPQGPPGVPFAGAPYRWIVFSTYDYQSAWFASNTPSMFGGVPPSAWGDQNGVAAQMSSDKEVLRTLFTGKGYGGRNAVVVADEWLAYSSTNSKHGAALFRIKNTTNSAINWNVNIYMTSYPPWGESASVALNGASQWVSGGLQYPASAPVPVTLAIPPARTSTAVFVAGSSGPAQTPVNGINSRGLYLAFTNDCLNLPSGLQFVDDLDTATGGWDQ